MVNIYRNIRRFREMRGLSQGELAKLTGYADRTMISKIEAGLVDLSQTKIVQFANALGVTVSDLWDLEEEDYYLDPEVAQMAQELLDNPNFKILFDASRNLSKEDIERTVSIIEALKAAERK